MLKDSLFLTIPPDTLANQVHIINNQFSHTDHVAGNALIGLWVIGLIYTFFIFKRPK